MTASVEKALELSFSFRASLSSVCVLGEASSQGLVASVVFSSSSLLSGVC